MQFIDTHREEAIQVSQSHPFCGFECGKVGTPPIEVQDPDYGFCGYYCSKVGPSDPYIAPMSKCAQGVTVAALAGMAVAGPLGLFYEAGVEATVVITGATTAASGAAICLISR